MLAVTTQISNLVHQCLLPEVDKGHNIGIHLHRHCHHHQALHRRGQRRLHSDLSWAMLDQNLVRQERVSKESTVWFEDNRHHHHIHRVPFLLQPLKAVRMIIEDPLHLGHLQDTALVI